MEKIIIGIHGLGNKPEKELLEKWWLKSICEGLEKIGKLDFIPKFEMVYWADILNDRPLDPEIKDSESEFFLDEPYSKAPTNLELKTNVTRKKILGFLEDKMEEIFLNDDLSSNLNFISDLVFKKYFKELDIYYSEQPDLNDPQYKSAKDIIRQRLVSVLEKHKDKDIFLITHSMGSIIGYDVCSFIIPNIKINTFVTMGSPLGIPVLISKIAEEAKTIDKDISKLTTPQNIKNKWLNFSDIDDSVALNYNLADDFEENLSGVKVNDFIINNDYLVDGKRNPHKSFGYLRSSEFSNQLSDFLVTDCNSFKLWLLRNAYKLQNTFKGLKNKIRLNNI